MTMAFKIDAAAEELSVPRYQPVSEKAEQKVQLRRWAKLTAANDPFKSLVFSNLAYGQFPLEACYLPERQLLKDANGTYRRELAKALLIQNHHAQAVEVGPGRREVYTPLAPALLRIMENPGEYKSSLMLISAAEQYGRMVELPGYSAKHADIEIARNHVDALAECMNGTYVVELGVGDGKKAATLLKNVLATGAKPAGYVLTDIVPGMPQSAKRQLLKTGFDADDIHCASGDFFTDAFWQKPIWKKLRDSGRPAVIMMQGATFNDFTYKEMHQLLTTINKNFAPGTSIVLSIDSTASPQLKANLEHMLGQRHALERAYVNSESMEFLFKGFVHGIEAIRGELDPRKIDGTISAYYKSRSHAAIRLGPFRTPEFYIPSPYGTEPGIMYCPPRDGIFFGEIHKVSEDKMGDVFKKAGQELVNILNYCDVYGIHPFVRQAWWHVRTPDQAPAPR